MTLEASRRLRGRLPDFVAVAQRFPLPVAAFAALTAYLLLELHKLPAQDEWRTVRIPVGLSAAAIWSFAATLSAEARSVEAQKIPLGLAGWCGIALLLALANVLSFDFLLFKAGLVMGLAVAPFIGRPVRNAAFWQFNHLLWTGLAIATIAMILAAGGVSAVIETLRFLFGLTIPYAAHEKIWIIACAFVGPVYWLSITPSEFESGVVEGEPQEFLSRAIATLGRYILVPLLLIYALILHAYAVKILFDQSLPKGRLGWMVTSYGVVMAMTALLTFPTRNVAGPMVRYFWNWWPYLLVVPLLLLGMAAGARINQYGLTDQRYLLVLAGVWLAALAVTQGLLARSRERNLLLMPAVAAGLMLVASLGPWGMTGWSVRSQAREINARLTSAGLVKDGRVLAAAQSSTALKSGDLQAIHSGIDYLNRHGRLGDLKPLFASHPKDPFLDLKQNSPRRDDYALADRIRDTLGIGPRRGPGGFSHFSHNSSSPGSFMIGANARLVGPLSMTIKPDEAQSRSSIELQGGKVEMEIAGKMLMVKLGPEASYSFDLTHLSRAGMPRLEGRPTSALRTPIELVSEPGARRAKMIVLTAHGRALEPDPPKVNGLTFWIITE